MAGLGSIWSVGGVEGVGGWRGGGVVKIAKAPQLGSILVMASTLKRHPQAHPNPLGPASTGRRPGGTLTLTPVPTLISLYPPPSSPPTHPPPAPPKPTTNRDQTALPTHLECSKAGQGHGGSGTTGHQPGGGAGPAIPARSLSWCGHGTAGPAGWWREGGGGGGSESAPPS